MGQNLFDLKKERGKLTVKTVATIAVECITAMEEVHSKGFLHVDVKPDNFAIGMSATDTRVYLLDMGLSEKYTIAGVHIQYSEGVPFQGSPFFSSLSCLLGIRHSRRDDLEALGNVLLFLQRGDLPWFAEFDSETEAMTQIAKIRERISLKALCADVEPEFAPYFTYCRNLRFEEKPNYSYLRGLFTQMANRTGAVIDGKYDWTPPSPPKTPKKSPGARPARLSSTATSRFKEIKVFHLPKSTPGALISALSQNRTGDSGETAQGKLAEECETPLIPANEVPALFWPRAEAVESRRELLKQIV